MSKITDCDTAPSGAGSVEHRLARVLEAPFLARVVPHLPPETLHRLVRHRGLEACGAILTSATPAQLASLLDLDLWRPAQPGRDERFDADRFGEWVEVLVEAGDAVAARTVAALDTDVVIVGLSRYVRVFDPGIFEPVAQSDDEPVDRDEAMREGDVLDVDETMGSEEADDAPEHDSSGHGIECELGGYIVRARRPDAWDAIVALLVALEAEHGQYFHVVMQGCRRLSHSRPETDGLDDLLLAPEQQLHDIAIGRESRRSQQGYATPADARAFLQMARQSEHPSSGVNPIVTAYFRAADEALPPSTASAHPDAADVPEPIAAVIQLLAEAGLMPERPRALLEAADAGPQAAGLTHLRRLMEYVRATDETACLTRGRELAFLANALLAGGTVQDRPFTPREASDAAAAICNLGLESWTDTGPVVIDRDLVTAFEAGWSVLHRDVSLFVAERLLATLADLHGVDRDIRRGLDTLRRELEKQRDAGTPWRARGAAEVLAMLDPTAGAGVLGLLGECPVLPAALTAVLDGRTTTVSPTEFDFISTAVQIGAVRAFMGRLPDLLSR